MIRIVLIAVLLYAAQALEARASMTCKRMEELPVVSDSQVYDQLKAYAKGLPGLKTFHIRQLTSRYFVIAPDEENCKSSTCYYRLLDFKGGALKEAFSFRGTGVIWIILSPTEVPLDYFQDEYARIALEMPGKSYLGVALPRSRDALLIEVVSPELARSLQHCGANSK